MRTLNTGRIREATKGPGSDTRVWAAVARVDDDPDARRWDPVLGWLVDVTFQGGPLDQEGPVPCRVAASYAARNGRGRSEPPELGAVVAVLLPEGNPNAEPIILGALYAEDAPAPDQSEADAEARHLLRTEHGVRIEAGGTVHLLGPLVELAEASAGQSFVRGDDLVSWIKDYQTALDAYLSAIASLSPVAIGTAKTAWTTTAWPALSLRLSSLLSSRIKGE